MIWLLDTIILLIFVEFIIYIKLKNVIQNIYFLSKNILSIFIENEENLKLKQARLFEKLNGLLKIYLNFFKNLFIIFLFFLFFKIVFNYDLKIFIFKFFELKFLMVSIISIIIYIKLRKSIIDKF